MIRTTGQLALVDDQDFDRLNETPWYLSPNGYAYSPYYDPIYLHRAVLGLKKGDKVYVDHINHDKMDNRKINLRESDPSTNGANRKIGINSKSGFKGVYFCKRKKVFKAHIKYKGKKIHLGVFDSAVVAANAYDLYAKNLFGDFSLLNFPKGGN